jgi:hypothetical protein
MKVITSDAQAHEEMVSQDTRLVGMEMMVFAKLAVCVMGKGRVGVP